MRAVVTALSVASLPSCLAGCGDSAKLPEQASTGANPPIPEPDQILHSHRQHRPRQGLAGRRQADAGRRARGHRLRRRARSSALALRAAERRRAGRRDQRAAQRPEDGKGIKGWVMKQVQKQGRRRRAERQPHHAAARRRRRRRRRDAHRVPRGPATRRSAWRWSATTSTSPTPTRSCASRTATATTQITRAGDEGRRPARRADQPSLDQEPHRQPRRLASSTSTVGSNSNVGENGIDEEEGRAAIWEIDRATGAAAHLRVGPAQPGRHGLGAADRRAVDGRSTSATSSAATSCPTT